MLLGNIEDIETFPGPCDGKAAVTVCIAGSFAVVLVAKLALLIPVSVALLKLAKVALLKPGLDVVVSFSPFPIGGATVVKVAGMSMVLISLPGESVVSKEGMSVLSVVSVFLLVKLLKRAEEGNALVVWSKELPLVVAFCTNRGVVSISEGVKSGIIGVSDLVDVKGDFVPVPLSGRAGVSCGVLPIAGGEL